MTLLFIAQHAAVSCRGGGTHVQGHVVHNTPADRPCCCCCCSGQLIGARTTHTRTPQSLGMHAHTHAYTHSTVTAAVKDDQAGYTRCPPSQPRDGECRAFSRVVSGPTLTQWVLRPLLVSQTPDEPRTTHSWKRCLNNHKRCGRQHTPRPASPISVHWGR